MYESERGVCDVKHAEGTFTSMDDRDLTLFGKTDAFHVKHEDKHVARGSRNIYGF